jgi:flagellin
MALTVTNVNALSLLNILNRVSNEQSNSLSRLATGSKLNRGADDPAGLIVSQSLGAELTGVEAAITNGQRAKSVLGTADGSVKEVSTLLSGGRHALNSNANNAVAVAKAALSQVATVQGRVGGFEKFQVDTSINSLNATKEALTSARAVIRGMDFAQETAELSRQHVLLQSTISLLGMASQQSSQILALPR